MPGQWIVLSEHLHGRRTTAGVTDHVAEGIGLLILQIGRRHARSATTRRVGRARFAQPQRLSNYASCYNDH